MKRLIFAVLCIGMVLGGLAACAETPPSEVEETTIGDTDQNTDFAVSIWATKSVYQADEMIECYGMVTYMGDEDITVYSSDPLLAFSLEGGVFEGGASYADVLMSTTFAPGEETVIPFQKSGGWSADDPNADFFEAFYADDALVLPPGEYTLSAIMCYSTDDNDVVGTQQELTASVTITVVE